MYGCETWATTKYLLSHLDAFDTWALRKIMKIPYICHMSDAEVRRTTGCSPLCYLVTNRCLRFTSRGPPSSPCSVYPTSTARLEATSRKTYSHTWLRAIEADLGPLNFGLATAWRKATTRDEWRHMVDTATFQRSTLWKKKKSWFVDCVSCRQSELSSVIFFTQMVSSPSHQVWFQWNMLWMIYEQGATKLQSGCWLFAYIMLIIGWI